MEFLKGVLHLFPYIATKPNSWITIAQQSLFCISCFARAMYVTSFELVALVSALTTIFASSSQPTTANYETLMNAPVPLISEPVSGLKVSTDRQRQKRSVVQPTASSAVLFPAYLYPLPGAWDPLYEAVANNPSVTFHIIINPDTGPGGSSPDSSYIVALQTLREYANAVLIGYVHTSWTARSTDLVFADIDQYTDWATTGYGLDGIFFDEAIQQVTSTAYTYMANITCHAKEVIQTSALNFNPMVYFNPGAIPDVRYYTLADYIAVFEDSFANYLIAAETLETSMAGIPITRSAFIIHTLSSSWTAAQMSSFVDTLADTDDIGSIFLTDNPGTGNPYGSFAGDFATFVSGVNALSSL